MPVSATLTGWGASDRPSGVRSNPYVMGSRNPPESGLPGMISAREQLLIFLRWVNPYRAYLAGVKVGAFTYVGWQVNAERSVALTWVHGFP